MPTHKPFEFEVGGISGAPMGRRSDDIADFCGKVRLQVVPFVDGDYDRGGAYWGGGGLPLFCAWDDDGHVRYLRARNRDEAKALLAPLKFYR